MEDPQQVNANMRQAIALMTAWNESDDGDTSFVTQLVAEDLANAVHEGVLLGESVAKITGLMSLAGRLLIQLEQTSGVPVATILQRIGAQSAE